MLDFVPTKWDSAKNKEQFLEMLQTFVYNGFAKEDFTPALYRRLHQMFGHEAHFDRDGFYADWFSSPEKQLRWIQHVLKHTPMGDPAFTWTDVERAFQEWLEGAPAKKRLEELVERRAHPFKCNASDRVVDVITERIQKAVTELPSLSLKQIVIGVLDQLERSGCISSELMVCDRCNEVVAAEFMNYVEGEKTQTVCDRCIEHE